MTLALCALVSFLSVHGNDNVMDTIDITTRVDAHTPIPTSNPTALPTANPTSSIDKPSEYAGLECPSDHSVPEASIILSGSTRIIRSDGCPGYDWKAAMKGEFAALKQSHNFRVPVNPTMNADLTDVSQIAGPIGVMLNGVPFYAPKDNAGRDAVIPAFSIFGSGQLQCGVAALTLIRGTTTSQSCANSCSANAACTHFTYWSTQQRCSLFADCLPLVGGGVDAQSYKMDVNSADANDQCAGHADASGVYHYRTTPGDDAQTHFKSRNHDFNTCSSLNAFMEAEDTSQHSPLIGFALDGIPLYGPRDVDGQIPSDLDTCNGHTDSEHPFYHYHTTSNYPYTVGCFRGCIDDITNPAFSASTCTQLTIAGEAVAYDYSSIAHVHSPTAASYGVQGASNNHSNTDLVTTSTTSSEAAGNSAFFGGSSAGGLVTVTVPAGFSVTEVVTNWVKQTVMEYGILVTADPTKGSNLVAHIDSAYPGGDARQSFGRVILTSRGIQTGSALNALFPNGKVWGKFDQDTNILKMYFAEHNHHLAARFIDQAALTRR